MEKIKEFFKKHETFHIREVKNIEKLEVTLKTSEVFDLEKLLLFTLEGPSVVFKSKILDKGSHSGVIIDTNDEIIWIMTAKEFSEMENLLKMLKKAKELSTLFSLLERYKPEELEVCYMIDVDGDYLIRYVIAYRFDPR